MISNRSKNYHTHKRFVKSKDETRRTCTVSSQNIENLQARRIIKECKATNDCQRLVDNLNEGIFARANQPYRLALFMDESILADNYCRLATKEINFLRKYADPPAIYFVEEALHEVSVLNCELISFKLRLRLEPPDGEGAA
jgi:hypothetical protein